MGPLGTPQSARMCGIPCGSFRAAAATHSPAADRLALRPACPSLCFLLRSGRYSHEITKEEIELYYHLPCEEASKQLGIGLTILKRICRRLGIDK